MVMLALSSLGDELMLMLRLISAFSPILLSLHSFFCFASMTKWVSLMVLLIVLWLLLSNIPTIVLPGCEYFNSYDAAKGAQM